MAPIYLGKRVVPSSLRYIENLACHQGNLDSTELLTEGASAWVYSGVLPLATAGLRAATLDNKLIITGI